MADFVQLTRDDVALLQQVIDGWRRQRLAGINREAAAPRSFSPETYVARTPAGGIPALTEETGTGIEDSPGSADCLIFRKDPSTSKLVLMDGVERTVNNLSHERIGGRRWVLVTRDKAGDWYVSGLPGPTPEVSDTGTGTGIGFGTGTGIDGYCPDLGLNFDRLAISDSPDWVLGIEGGCIVKVPVGNC